MVVSGGVLGVFVGVGCCIGVRMFLVMRLSGFVSGSIVGGLSSIVVVWCNTSRPLWGYVTVWLRFCQGVCVPVWFVCVSGVVVLSGPSMCRG